MTTQREIKFRAWDGDTSLGYKQHGYQLRKADWHPHCSKRGYVMEHRLIMEKKLGRYIPKHAVIHHKNGVRNDNRIGNLEYMPEQVRHAKKHDTGKRNPNGQFVAQSPEFQKKKFRLLNKNTGLMQIFTLSKLISTTFRKSQFEYRGEFTGLHDKNGVEIYKGDVVDTKMGCRAVCEFGIIEPAAVSGFYFKAITDEPGFYAFDNTWLERLAEVIGNIYENPELLKFK